MNRAGLKLSCFVVSVLIWVQVASTSTVEQIAQLPLRVTRVEDGLTVAGSDIPARVKVRVQGSKLGLLSHKYFNRYVGEVRVNLAGHGADSTFSYPLSVNDVFTGDLVVVAIQPPVTVNFRLDRELGRMLPVRLVTSGTLAADVGFLDTPEVSPDSVMVTGPERFFPQSGHVNTETVDLGRRASSSEEKVALVLPHADLKMASREVRVRFNVAPLVERTLANLPVIPLVDTGQPEVVVSPPVVDVMVRGVADSVRALRGDRVLVTVPVGDLGLGVHMVSGEASLPPWLVLIGLDPPEFQVVVGRVEPGWADSLRLGAESPNE